MIINKTITYKCIPYDIEIYNTHEASNSLTIKVIRKSLNCTAIYNCNNQAIDMQLSNIFSQDMLYIMFLIIDIIDDYSDINQDDLAFEVDQLDDIINEA